MTISETIQLLTPKEVQAYLRISSTALYRLERDGLLLPLRLKTGPNQHRRFQVSALHDFIESRTEHA